MEWIKNQEHIDFFNSVNQFPFEKEDLFRYSETKDNDEPDVVHLSQAGRVHKNFIRFLSRKIFFQVYHYCNKILIATSQCDVL